MRSSRRENLILVIILLVLGLGIGYAAITTTLTINGTTDFDRNVWNVYWDNVQVTTGSVTGTQVTQAPIITDQTVVSFQVNLKEPGEYYEFTVNANNSGTLDAMIDSISRPTNLPNYLKLTFTYEDDRELYAKQYLKKNTSERLKVRLEYRTDIDPSLLPNTDETVNLQVGVTYIQADSTAQTRVMYYYHSGSIYESMQTSQTKPNTFLYIAVEYGEGTTKRRTLYYRPVINSDYIFFAYEDSLSTNLEKLAYYCERIPGTLSSNSCTTARGYIYVNNNGSLRVNDSADCRIKADGSVECFGTEA